MTHTYDTIGIDSTGGVAYLSHHTPDKRFCISRLRTELDVTCRLIARVERGTLELDLPVAALVVAIPSRRNDACHVVTVNLN